MRDKPKYSLRDIIERRPHWNFFLSIKTSRIGSRIKKGELLKLKQSNHVQNNKEFKKTGVEKLK